MPPMLQGFQAAEFEEADWNVVAPPDPRSLVSTVIVGLLLLLGQVCNSRAKLMSLLLLLPAMVDFGAQPASGRRLRHTQSFEGNCFSKNGDLNSWFS